MKAVIQRVKHAKVSTKNGISGSIKKGYFILLGISEDDTSKDVLWLTNKICNLRIFDDNSGKMNLNIKDVNGDCLVVSQFTLHAKTKKGNRPSFIKAAEPNLALSFYNQFITEFEKLNAKKCETGIFGEHMDIELCNDGPVTIIIDTKNKE